jgi:hypothetical protein
MLASLRFALLRSDPDVRKGMHLAGGELVATEL